VKDADGEEEADGTLNSVGDRYFVLMKRGEPQVVRLAFGKVG
jgi:hypothetical protein